MRIQVVSKYLTLAEEGLVLRVDCPLDQGLFLPNLDDEDNIFLYCISCNYKKTIGQSLYRQMEDAIKNANK